MQSARALIFLVFAMSGVAACGEAFRGSQQSDTGGSGAAASSAGSSNRAGAGGASTGPSSGQGSGGERAGENAGGEADPGIEGGAPSGGTDGAAGIGGTPEEPPTACQSLSACAKGQNCVDELCVPALGTCAAQKNKYPASKDGVYWTGTDAQMQMHRSYCDMEEAIELCSDAEADRVGRTRDSSKLEYKMRAVLLEDGLCKMWNLRAAADNYPLWKLEAVAGVPAAQTCAKLGFVADGVLGSCPYGETRTNCGYPVTPLNRYGNTCTSCVLNDGDFDHWVPQGPIKLGGVLSNASGTTFTTCKTNK